MASKPRKPTTPWTKLDKDYRLSLEKRGYRRAMHEAGVSKKAARGHKNTPEHPSDVQRHPDRYKGYKQRRDAQYIQGITKNGVQLLRLNARDRTTVAKHWNAVHKWMRTGKGDLPSYEGRTVHDKLTGQDVELETDTTAIWRYTHQRLMNIPIYEELL